MSTTYTYVACRDEGSIEAYVLDDAEGRLNRFAVVEGLEDVAMLAMDLSLIHISEPTRPAA